MVTGHFPWSRTVFAEDLDANAVAAVLLVVVHAGNQGSSSLLFIAIISRVTSKVVFKPSSFSAL